MGNALLIIANIRVKTIRDIPFRVIAGLLCRTQPQGWEEAGRIDITLEGAIQWQIGPAVPNLVHVRVTLRDVQHIFCHFLIRDRLGNRSKLPMPHLHRNMWIGTRISIPVSLSTPARRNTVAVMFTVVNIFKRRMAQLAAFAACGGQQQNRTTGQPSLTEFLYCRMGILKIHLKTGPGLFCETSLSMMKVSIRL